MQQAAHLIINDRIIKVLARLVKKRRNDGSYVALKIRTSGNLGSLLSDESKYLETEPKLLADLMAGKVIHC